MEINGGTLLDTQSAKRRPKVVRYLVGTRGAELQALASIPRLSSEFLRQ